MEDEIETTLSKCKPNIRHFFAGDFNCRMDKINKRANFLENLMKENNLTLQTNRTVPIMLATEPAQLT